MVESTLHLTFYLEYKPKIVKVGKERQLVVANISKGDILKTIDPILMILFTWLIFALL